MRVSTEDNKEECNLLEKFCTGYHPEEKKNASTNAITQIAIASFI